MNVEKLNVQNVESLEYEICVYLMRNRILNACICLPDETLMDRLSDYMSLCRIPWAYEKEQLRGSMGYLLSTDIPTDSNELQQVLIFYKFPSQSLQNENAICIELEGESLLLDEQMEEIDLDKVPMHLQNAEIRKMFLYAFKVAETEIDIISPWMNAGVINEHFLMLMEQALNRGVKISILYGLKPDSNEYNLSRSRRSDQMAELMRSRFSKQASRLTIRRDNIHYKLVLCDEKYKLEGGFNYLSFIGSYDNSDTRREGSPFGRNAEEIRLLRKQYFEE